MTDPIFLPGGRGGRGTLDVASEGPGETAGGDTADRSAATACVVACPPHPQHGGTRDDGRLRAVSDCLQEAGVDCLRFDYGAWDGGRGERDDALRAVAWARERYESVGLFGYSFGGTVALSAARRADVATVAALAPPARLGSTRTDTDAPADVGGIDAVTDLALIPESVAVGVLYGTRDDVADVAPVVAAARERGASISEFDAGHFFVGQERTVAEAAVDLVAPPLRADGSRPPS